MVLKMIENTVLLKAPYYVLLLVIGILKDGITTFYIACILVIILALLAGLLSSKQYFPTFVSLFVVSAHACSVTNVGPYMHSNLALCFMCLSAAGFILYKRVCWKLFSCIKI